MLISGELAGHFQLNAWAMIGALASVLLFSCAIVIVFVLTLAVAVQSLKLIKWLLLLPLILVFRLLGFAKEKEPEKQSQAQSHSKVSFEDALQMVRDLEVERQKKGFKPGWLFFQCKEDELLLEALEYLRSTGEIPQHERSRQKDSRQQEKASAEKYARKAESFDPYEVLGVKPNASPLEIKSSYRNQMKLYHPDRVAHLGEALRELANRRTQDIQRAFETLMPQS